MSSEGLGFPGRSRWIDTAAKWIEELWAACFSWSGGRYRGKNRLPLAENPTRSRLMVLAPHPDDEMVGCGVALIQHLARQDTVWLLHVTDGRQSRAGGLRAEDMAARRSQEAHQAAETLGVDRHIWCGLPEGAWVQSDLSKKLRRLVPDLQPDYIYAPSRVDFHPEHLRVAGALAAFLGNASLDSGPPLIRIYPIQVPLTPILANAIVPVGKDLGFYLQVLRLYQSQWPSVQTALRQRRYAGRMYHHPDPVEEYWELTPGQYRRLHENLDSQGQNAFRGLRVRPWSDPLAYLVGKAMRRSLRELAYEGA